jgi:nucleotide-binding universal stress UspA family protein
MYKHILVPTDGSELSNKAIRAAIQLAKALGANVTGFYATEEYPVPSFADFVGADIPSPEHFQRLQEGRAKKYLDVLIKEARMAGVHCNTDFVTSAHPYKAIIQAAETHGCDLIMMASHGRQGIGGLVLGSETNKVLTHTTVPVLVCR